MKILIAVDIEGIAGIANTREYEHFQFGREWCTLDTNAAVEGALAGGATEITVSDTHGRHNDNISFDLLHPKARLIRGGKNTPLYFMEGLTEDTNLVLLVGWHDKIGGPGVLSHTFVHKEIIAMRINGVEVGEVEIAAGVAGHFGVSIGFISGDDVTCKASKQFLWRYRIGCCQTRHRPVCRRLPAVGSSPRSDPEEISTSCRTSSRIQTISFQTTLHNGMGLH